MVVRWQPFVSNALERGQRLAAQRQQMELQRRMMNLREQQFRARMEEIRDQALTQQYQSENADFMRRAQERLGAPGRANIGGVRGPEPADVPMMRRLYNMSRPTAGFPGAAAEAQRRASTSTRPGDRIEEDVDSLFQSALAASRGPSQGTSAAAEAAEKRMAEMPERRPLRARQLSPTRGGEQTGISFVDDPFGESSELVPGVSGTVRQLEGNEEEPIDVVEGDRIVKRTIPEMAGSVITSSVARRPEPEPEPKAAGSAPDDSIYEISMMPLSQVGPALEAELALMNPSERAEFERAAASVAADTQAPRIFDDSARLRLYVAQQMNEQSDVGGGEEQRYGDVRLSGKTKEKLDFDRLKARYGRPGGSRQELLERSRNTDRLSQLLNQAVASGDPGAMVRFQRAVASTPNADHGRLTREINAAKSAARSDPMLRATLDAERMMLQESIKDAKLWLNSPEGRVMSMTNPQQAMQRLTEMHGEAAARTVMRQRVAVSGTPELARQRTNEAASLGREAGLSQQAIDTLIQSASNPEYPVDKFMDRVRALVDAASTDDPAARQQAIERFRAATKR